MVSEIFKLNPEIKETVNDLSSLMRDKNYKLCLFLSDLPEILIADFPEADKRLGYYNPSLNQIIISSVLLPEALRVEREGVFLHEFAHFVDYRYNGKSSHGKDFHTICKRIGVVEGFDKAVAKVRGFESVRSKAESKMKKLMALSSSPFEAEAKSAFEKAQKLCKQFSLDFLLKDEVNELFGFHDASCKRLSLWKSSLAMFVSSITGAFPVISPTGSGNKAVHFYGSREQVESSLYLWLYFVENFDKKYRENKENLTRQDKTSFYLSMIKAVKDNLNFAESTDIMLSQKKIRETYRTITEAKLCKGRGGRYNSTVRGTTLGREAGSSISMPSLKKATAYKQIGC